MNNELKVACVYYEPDYERIVKEIKEYFKKPVEVKQDE